MTERPLGERLTALETELPHFARQLEETNLRLEKLTTTLSRIEGALQRRAWSLRVVGWVVDVLKLAIAAALGAGGAAHFIGRPV